MDAIQRQTVPRAIESYRRQSPGKSAYIMADKHANTATRHRKNDQQVYWPTPCPAQLGQLGPLGIGCSAGAMATGDEFFQKLAQGIVVPTYSPS